MRDLKINWHRSINFGDQLNPYLINHFLGYWPQKYEIWNEKRGRHEELTEPHIMLLGSILNEANHLTTVVGAGFVSETSICISEPNILSVRGKLTLKRIKDLYGSTENIFLGDPALSIPKIYSPNVGKKYDLGIIPHLIDEDIVRKKFKDCRIISLKMNSSSAEEIERIITEINECECTISSSLHGLIISHSYGIPSLWVEFSDNVIGGGFKFMDYFSNHVNSLEDLVGIHPVDLRNGMSYYSYDELLKIARKFPIHINQREIDDNYDFYRSFFVSINK